MVLRLLAVGSIALLGACQQISGSGLPWFDGGESRQSADQQGASNWQQSHRAQVERAQQLLSKLGYGVGEADGIVGPRTRKAVTAYQRDRGLPQDGEVTAGLIQSLETSLRLGKARAAETASPAPEPKSDRADPRLEKLPVYERGSTFVYSDGSVERVAAVKDATVRWAAQDGTHFTAYRNFLLPWSYWQTATERGTATLEGDPGIYWPLQSNEEMSFSAQVAVQDRADTTKVEQTVETWRCRLLGRDRLLVMAGSFDTVIVTCDRKGGRADEAVRRTWHYAPDVGHYVRRDEVFADAALNQRTELVAIQPAAPGWPPVVRAALDRAVQQALEAAPDGAREDWNSSGVDTRVTIQTAARFRRADGASCRSYMQIWSGPEGERRYPAAACLGASGRWRIPGLDSDPNGALAVSGTHS